VYLVAISMCVAGAYTVFYLKPGYWKRFSDIWENGDAYITFVQRFEIWKINFKLMQNHWVLGTGFGRSGNLVAKVDASIGRLNAHNSWIAMLSEAGLPGLLHYVFIFSVSTYVAFQLSRNSSSFETRWFGVAAFSSFMAYFGISFGHAREFYEFSYILSGAVLSIHFDMSQLLKKQP